MLKHSLRLLARTPKGLLVRADVVLPHVVLLRRAGHRAGLRDVQGRVRGQAWSWLTT